jgi:hypothetical protein
MGGTWMIRGALLVALALVGSPIEADAQGKIVMSRLPSHAAQLKSALRSVLSAQVKHHTAKRTYAPSVEALRLPPSPGVTVEILAAGPSGWQARAMHQEQPGRSCVIFVGSVEGGERPRTDGDRDMAGEEGVPLCDRMR